MEANHTICYDDVCVVPGPPEDYDSHPSCAILVVEVSTSSLIYDQTTKQSLYASMAVPEYWVRDLNNSQLHVYRQPAADSMQPFGHRYEQVKIFPAEGHVSPLEKSAARLAIIDMLPLKV